MYLETDILIIGGGSAGCIAAITAKEHNPDADVLVIEKGEIHRSGSIARGMDALNVVVQPSKASPDLYLEAARIATAGIIDSKPSYILAEKSYALLKRLEAWGVRFPRTQQGEYVSLQVHPKGAFLVEMDAPDLKLLLAQKVVDAGVQVLNRTMMTRLIEVEEQVGGGMGFNLRTGELVVCSAKATILANGGCARFSLPDSGYLYGTFDYPGNAGDGYSMAFHAGAQLTGFEYTLCAPLIKDLNCPLLYITLTRGAEVVNALGQRVDFEHLSTQSMLQELREGRGPLFIKLSHLSEEKIQEIERILFSTERPLQKRFWDGRGVDFRQNMIELGQTEYQLCGGHGLTGLVVNELAETTLPNLYAAGDVACVPMQHLTGALVFGAIAGQNAATRVGKIQRLGIKKTDIQAEEQRLFQMLDEKSKGAPITLAQFEYKVRRTVSDYIVPPKNEQKLSRALWWIHRFRKELENMSAGDYHELGRLIELQCILDCAELSAVASLKRQESRWGWFHYRTDYPQQDDKNWLVHIVLKRGKKPGEITTALLPIDHEGGRPDAIEGRC